VAGSARKRSLGDAAITRIRVLFQSIYNEFDYLRERAKICNYSEMRTAVIARGISVDTQLDSSYHGVAHVVLWGSGAARGEGGKLPPMG